MSNYSQRPDKFRRIAILATIFLIFIISLLVCKIVELIDEVRANDQRIEIQDQVIKSLDSSTSNSPYEMPVP